MFLIYTRKSQQIGVRMTHKADHMEDGDKWNFKVNKMRNLNVQVLFPSSHQY